RLGPTALPRILDDSTHQVKDGNGCYHSASISNLFALSYAHKVVTSWSMSQLYYHYSPIREKKSSSWPSVDTSKATHISRRRSLLHFSFPTSELTFSAFTHLRNLYVSKKIPSQCRYQVYTFDSSNLSLLSSTLTILGLDASS
ncbi:hypothetical protein Tco_1435225, partial [Tanacetum coccineum]